MYIELFAVDCAALEQLVEMAQRQGIIQYTSFFPPSTTSIKSPYTSALTSHPLSSCCNTSAVGNLSRTASILNPLYKNKLCYFLIISTWNTTLK